jgi:hypothetical protein
VNIRISVKKRSGMLLLLGGLALLSRMPAQGQTTIYVTDPSQVNPATCTLSNAIAAANAGSAVGACLFTGSGAPYTIQLHNVIYRMASADNYWYGPNALPPIASNIIIEGNGATLAITDSTIVRLRFFYVGADPTAAATLNFNTPGAGNLTLHNLMLAGGKQKGGDTYFGGGGAGMGGAIFNQGSLTLGSVTLTGNSASGGNGQVDGTGPSGSTSSNGGGMGSEGGSNSTLSGNAATGGNRALGLGGAIFNLNGSVIVQYSTLAGNTVAPASLIGGGAIYSVGDNLQAGQAASLTISNSIVANSIGGPDLVTDQPSAATSTLTYQDQNIVMSSLVQGGATSSGPAPLTSDPQLAPLNLNAPGLTETMAIGTSSPAFIAGVCESNITNVDQRGISRPQSASCDIGAYELVPLVPVIIASSPAGLSFSVSGSGCQPGSYTTGNTTLEWQVGASCSVVA